MSYNAPDFEGMLDYDLSIFLKEKLTKALIAQQDLKQTKAHVELALTKADKYVADCETRLRDLGFDPSAELEIINRSALPQPPFSKNNTQQPPSTRPAMANEYNPNWFYLDKIKYVLRNPSKYGFPTFKGAGSVVKAIFIEEPQFRADEKSAIIQVAPQVSRVVSNGDAVKALARGSKVDFHFISADWFDDAGQIKPEHLEAVAGLDVPPLKKKPV